MSALSACLKVSLESEIRNLSTIMCININPRVSNHGRTLNSISQTCCKRESQVGIGIPICRHKATYFQTCIVEKVNTDPHLKTGDNDCEMDQSVYQNQNALQRLLEVTLDEHCSRIGLVGPHNLLLFGSEIVTREIATASASTKPPSSFSALSWLELLEDESPLESSSTELLSPIFLFESGITLVTGSW